MHGPVREFAPAKINLALHVLGRRADGYHELDSAVAFASIGDELDIEISAGTSLSVIGPFAADVPINADNLVLKAHAAIAAHATIPDVAMRLTKNLPVASGIGGGSADAAAALRGIMQIAGIRFDSETKQKIALSLGADVPVCLHGKACRMQGVGEVITQLEQLPAPAILLVNPLQGCSTVEVFRRIGLKAGEQFGTALEIATHDSWRNDMMTAAIAVLPVIDDVLSALRAISAAKTVRMSGSGATCFALFERMQDAEAAADVMKLQYPNWWIAPAQLS